MISQQSNLQFYHVRWSNKVIIIIVPLMNRGFPQNDMTNGFEPPPPIDILQPNKVSLTNITTNKVFGPYFLLCNDDKK